MFSKNLVAFLLSVFFMNGAHAYAQTVSDLSSLVEGLYNTSQNMQVQRQFDQNGSEEIYAHNEKILSAMRARIKREAPAMIKEINQCKNQHASEKDRQVCVRNSFENLGKNGNLTALELLIRLYDQEGRTSEKNRCQLASNELSKKIEKDLKL